MNRQNADALHEEAKKYIGHIVTLIEVAPGEGTKNVHYRLIGSSEVGVGKVLPAGSASDSDDMFLDPKAHLENVLGTELFVDLPLVLVLNALKTNKKIDLTDFEAKLAF